MKLRNKRTGEITDLNKRGLLKSYDNQILVYQENGLKFYAYNSLAKLNEEWEDYKPKEPLIKDENIRKIIRAWADENDTTVVEYKLFKNEFVDGYLNIIGFNRKFNELCDKSYTIDELCGEEEE